MEIFYYETQTPLTPAKFLEDHMTDMANISDIMSMKTGKVRWRKSENTSEKKIEKKKLRRKQHA